MPTRLLLFVLGLTFSFCASATTGFVDPLVTAAPSVSRPSRSPLTAVTIAGDRLVAAGWRGLIMYSDDGGKSWRQSSVPVSVDLTAIAFPTPTDGWVVGHDGGGIRYHQRRPSGTDDFQSSAVDHACVFDSFRVSHA
jgi:photosystem II stability/assembly factor-like uncharacterized protein